jgi:hypothetical protein
MRPKTTKCNSLTMKQERCNSLAGIVEPDFEHDNVVWMVNLSSIDVTELYEQFTVQDSITQYVSEASRIPMLSSKA